MKNLSKKICAVLVAGTMVLGTAACGSSSSGENSGSGDKETVTLKFFNGNVEMVDWYNDAVERFNEEHENIKVEHEFQKEGTSALQTKFAAGDIPDITNVGTQQMMDAGKFVDLSDKEWWDRIDPTIKEISADAKSGNNYCIPTNTNITGTIYNQKIFDELSLEPADTIDEFTENLRAVKEAYPDVTPLYLAGKEAWTVGMLIGYIAEAANKQEMGEAEYNKAALEGDISKLNFSKDGGPLEQFITWLGELQEEGLINSNVLTATYDDSMNAIATGEAAIIFQGMFTISTITGINPDAENELRVSAFPAVSSELKPAICQAIDSSYYITADSTHQEEAEIFLDWLFEVGNQTSFAETRNAPSAFTDVSVDVGPIYESALEAAKDAFVVGATVEPAGFGGDATGIMIQEFFAGQYTPQEFAKAFEEGWESAYNAQ